MSTPSVRGGLLAIALGTGLTAGGLVAAAPADASTLYACVKKSGTAHIFTKKPKCKKGEQRLSWNVNGPAGANGPGGAKGSNGTNGTNGTNGQDLTSHTPLPSGQSESGWFALGGGSSTSGEVGEGITFSQPLSAGLKGEHAIFNAPKETSTKCPGAGQAEKGFLCLYASEVASLTFVHTLGFSSGEENATGKFGCALYFAVKAALGFVDGTWTVTAP